VFTGYEPPPYYDSLLAKIISWGADRDEAIRRMARALSETRMEGPATNLDYHLHVLADKTFLAGRTHTQWSPRAIAPDQVTA
jgi:acetyl-CoA carboxylase biotin carboxylase subunit